MNTGTIDADPYVFAVTAVLDMATVTAVPPLNDVPDKPVPIVNALVVLAVTVPLEPSATEVPLMVTALLDSWVLVMLANVPPNVKFPAVVTEPVRVIPLTDPLPPTEVTVPVPLPLKVFQSVVVK